MMTSSSVTWASVVANGLPPRESPPKSVPLIATASESPTMTTASTRSITPMPMGNNVPTVFHEQPNPGVKNRWTGRRPYRPNYSNVHRMYQRCRPPMGWQIFYPAPPPLLSGQGYKLPSPRTIKLQNLMQDREQQQRGLYIPMQAYENVTVGQEQPICDTGIQQEGDAYAEAQWQPLKYSRQVWDPLDISQRSQDPSRLISSPPPGSEHVLCGKRSLSIRARQLLGEQVTSGPSTAYPTPQPMLTTEEDVREQHHFLADKDIHLISLSGQLRVSNGGTGDGHYVRAAPKLLPMAESMWPPGGTINFWDLIRSNQIHRNQN